MGLPQSQSGRADRRLAHYVLKVAALHKAPRAEGSIRELLTGLRQQLENNELDLPLLDPGVVELHCVLDEDDIDIDAVVRRISRDAGLAARVLRAANSAAVCRGIAVTDLRNACMRIGTKRIVALAFQTAVRGHFVLEHEPFAGVLRGLWKNSVVASLVSAALAPRLDREDGPLLSVATLLHNVGELLAVRLLSERSMDLPRPCRLSDLESEVHGVHEEMGLALAAAWGLPPELARLAGAHHRGPRGRETNDERQTRQLVIASWRIAIAGGLGYWPSHSAEDLPRALRPLGLRESEVADLVAKVEEWTP